MGVSNTFPKLVVGSTMGWTLLASEVVGFGPKIRVEIDASGCTALDTSVTVRAHPGSRRSAHGCHFGSNHRLTDLMESMYIV